MVSTSKRNCYEAISAAKKPSLQNINRIIYNMYNTEDMFNKQYLKLKICPKHLRKAY